MTKILLADVETTNREFLLKVLQEEGFEVTVVDNGLDAIDAIMQTVYDIAVLDVNLSGAEGSRAWQVVVKGRPKTRVILITAYDTVETAIEAIKMGAGDYVMRPIIVDEVIIKIKQQIRYRRLLEENHQLKNELDPSFHIDQMVSESPLMASVIKTIHKVAGTKSNVLITGESGTGKEMVAHAIHSLSQNFSGRFVAIHCGAIREELFECELFGHRKKKLTSAVEDKNGLLEAAQGGTLFLNEIGYMPLDCQGKLLRAIEERRIIPAGLADSIPIDLRIVTATSKNLQNEIAAGQFREDLYYRLNVVGIHLPPLRDRKEDIPALARQFVKKYNRELGKQCTGISDKAIGRLVSHEWKGNVRELQNLIERAILFTEGPIVDASDLGIAFMMGDRADHEDRTLQEAMRRFEKDYIIKILKLCQGDKGEAAKTLGVGVSTLYRKLSELEININPDMPGVK